MISKSAKNQNNFKRKICFTNAARDGWELILETLEPSAKVLLPSYIGITEREGSGIFDPITKTDVNYSFYALNDDLSISLQNIKDCLERETFDMILLVHYFGFRIKNIEEIVEVCKANNVTVVEDCAHLFAYNVNDLSDAGNYGDFAFYSLHKFFPIDQGGAYVQNNLELKTPNTSGLKLTQDYCQLLVSYNVDAIADKRIKNFKYIDRLIKNIDGVRPLMTLNENDIPHNYPIIVENNLREKLYFWLIDRGITLTALYYRLIDSIEKDVYKEMHDISNSILNLPIHQDMNEQDIRHLVEQINEGILELSK